MSELSLGATGNYTNFSNQGIKSGTGTSYKNEEKTFSTNENVSVGVKPKKVSGSTNNSGGIDTSGY